MLYGKKITAIIVIVVMITTIAIPTSANMGGYLDGLLSQMKGLAPKAYEGQSRGYFVGGSASVRWGFQEQPLVSFTPPSLKVGCSGIDLVMGGFSYLNFEHLVQKLQAILSAAPAFAFKIALKTLCESCDNVITALENIANIINQLNVDSCQAAKAIGGWAGAQLGQAIGNKVDTGEVGGWFKGRTETFKNVTAGWKDWIEREAGKYDCRAYAQGTEAYKACELKVGKISFVTPLMRQAFSRMGQTDFPFEAIFRARFGDVYQDASETNKDNIPKVQVDTGCYEKATFGNNIIEDMVTGTYKMKPNPSNTNAGCVDINNPNEGLEYKVEQVLISLKNKITSSSEPSPEELTLINATRIPVYRLMSLAALVDRIGGSQDVLTDNFVEKFKRPIAVDIAWSATTTLSATARNLLAAAIGSKSDIEQTVITAMNTIVNSIGQEITRADSFRRDAWQALRDQFGDLAQKELQMKAFIYQELAKNKLLDSYVYAKGIR